MQAASSTPQVIADTSAMPAGIDVKKMHDRRDAIGLTLDAAAKRAGLGMSHWADIESGRRSSNVKLSTLYAIAKALECEPSALLLPSDE